MKKFIVLLILPVIIFQIKNTIPNFSNPFPNKVLNNHQNTNLLTTLCILKCCYYTEQ